VSEYSKFQTKTFLLDSQDYFKNRSAKDQAGSNEQCNKYFATSDPILLRLTRGLVKYINRGLVNSYGLSTPTMDLKGTSILAKLCCNCPDYPVPFKKKNAARNKAEIFLKEWMYYASGESSDIDIPASKQNRKPIKAKNPFL